MRKRKGVPRPVYGPNARRYAMVCEWCGAQFAAARPEALTCRNACRLAWTRWVRKVAAMGKGVAVIGPRGDYRKQQFLRPAPRGA